MPVNIAINGFGRIGRSVARALYENDQLSHLKLVAINEIADPKGIAHLLKYDTTHGRFSFDVQLDNETLIIANDKVALSHCEQLSQLPWQAHNVDIVLDCTGKFGSNAEAMIHIQQGAKKYYFRTQAIKTLTQP